MIRNRLGRLGLTAAAATTAVVLGAGPAMAHHCYKNAWQQAAYEHHLKGGTPWMPLSDLGVAFLIGPDHLECAYVADDAVAAYMKAHGLTQEPLIHSRATTGGGAASQGKTVKPFSYLMDDDFAEVTGYLIKGMATCAPEWSPPEMD